MHFEAIMTLGQFVPAQNSPALEYLSSIGGYLWTPFSFPNIHSTPSFSGPLSMASSLSHAFLHLQ